MYTDIVSLDQKIDPEMKPKVKIAREKRFGKRSIIPVIFCLVG
jgi:hypothetical protein